jgi:hypothetical protein
MVGSPLARARWLPEIEVGDAIDPEHDGLAVDDKMLLPVLERSFGDPGIAPRPVMAAFGDEPHAVVLPDDEHPVAVELDFVEPVRAGRNLLAGSRDAGFKAGFEHADSRAISCIQPDQPTA